VIQLSLFADVPRVDVETAVQAILALRRKYGTRGQSGEAAPLIRAALIKETP